MEAAAKVNDKNLQKGKPFNNIKMYKKKQTFFIYIDFCVTDTKQHRSFPEIKLKKKKEQKSGNI